MTLLHNPQIHFTDNILFISTCDYGKILQFNTFTITRILGRVLYETWIHVKFPVKFISTLNLLQLCFANDRKKSPLKEKNFSLATC